MPLACHQSCLQVHLALIIIFLARMAYYVAYTLRQYVKAIPGAAQTIPEADGNGKGGSMSTTFVLVNALSRMICYYQITISRFVSMLRTFFLGFMSGCSVADRSGVQHRRAQTKTSPMKNG